MHVYLDSSFVVALLCKDHEEHAIAEKSFLILKRVPSKLYLSILTLDEVWYVLYRHDRLPNEAFSIFSKRFESTLREFMQTSKVIFPDVFKGVILLDTAIQASIKYNLRPRDAFHYAYAKNLKAKLFTLDFPFHIYCIIASAHK
jgi:predicted nucleic acid-binding protein